MNRFMLLLCAAIGCLPNAKRGNDQNRDDGGSVPESSDADTDADEGIPDTDECDEHAERIICESDTAIACDASGDVLSTTVCSPEREACIEDLGCSTCSISLETLHLPYSQTSAFIGIRPAITEENIAIERLYTRPMKVGISDSRRSQGHLELSSSDPHLALWLDTEPPLFADDDGILRIPVDQLPATVLAHAEGSGPAQVTATDPLCLQVEATADFHAGHQPTLTGTPISSAPWIHRADVFNHTDIINLAFSADRHADRVDTPVVVYIVPHRSPADWAADPTLNDVTEDGANLLFVGSTEDNIQALWSSSLTTSEDRFSEYDIVLDFDRDGTFSPGDIASGPGAHAPGLTVMGDLHGVGPHDVQITTTSGGSWIDQIIYYPSDIRSLESAPLIVISHGNGHNYLWYDYLGEHLASHGYVVMAHSNLTGPGIETASWTTLENTDYFFEAIHTIDSGVLSGRVDPDRIVWIGHSRGGEGVVRAYDRMVDEDYPTSNYDADSIVLISSIAPTVFYTIEYSNPHDRPYHLLAGAADGDVHGGPSSSVVQFFRLTSAAQAETQSTYLHGVGHNEFNCCGFADATGPDLIGRTAAQKAAKAYYLALIRFYVDGHAASLDFFSRRADVFRPANLAEDLVIANTYRPDKRRDVLVIDDFQAQTDTAVASSGWDVSFSVDELIEALLIDQDGAFSWDPSDPMNGMTQGCCEGDVNRGIVFSFDADSHISWTVPESAQDWSEWRQLSLRLAQGTRHPKTVALDDDLSFSIRLLDTEGEMASIQLESLGRITHPYRRTGLGAGEGWANEFNSIRVNLSAFDDANPKIDRTKIATLFVEFGPRHGSSQGRVALDDLLLEH